MVAALVASLFWLPLVLINILIKVLISYPKVSAIVAVILIGLDTKVIKIFINLFGYTLELISIYIVIIVQVLLLVNILYKNIINQRGYLVRGFNWLKNNTRNIYNILNIIYNKINIYIYNNITIEVVLIIFIGIIIVIYLVSLLTKSINIKRD